MRRIGYVVALVIAQGAAVASAQSLGEAAQKEKQKRQAGSKATDTPSADRKPKETKVFTGEDLESYAASRPAASEDGGTATPADTPAPAAAPPSTPRSSGLSPMGISDDSEQRAAQERNWRSRANAARAAVTAAEEELKRAESQRALLGPGPLPAGRGQNPAEWSRAANASDERLARARTGLEAAKEKLEQFEEEARRAGIPPGWIR